MTEKNDRKMRLVTAIKTSHPGVNVSTEWTSNDFDLFGIQISARHDTTGNFLSATRRDDEIDAMTEADVMAWVAKAVLDFEGRQKRTKDAIRIERETSH
jgi:hypothetical protein